MLCEKSMKYPKNITLKGRFTHYENNGYLYFNSKDENDLERHCIFTCLANLNNSYSKENNYYRNYLYLQEIDYKVGDVYAAIYPQDKMFYRVKILQILDFEKVLVCFIDYGNTEIIAKAELATLPHQISHIKPLALLCKIPNIKLIFDKSFMKIIQELCVNDISITIESRTKMKIVNEGGLVENLEVNLINFQYNGHSIRDYLLRNKIAENFDEIYEEISLWPNDDVDVESQIKLSTKQDNSSTCNISPSLEYSKSVIITSVSSECNIFVHDFSKSVKTKLESLQAHISKVVENFKIQISDNMFNKRSMYLAQFSEDSLWYRCKISNFDSTYGFLVQYIDFGNSEYKTSLSELMLLSRDMGSDAIYLIDEDPIAQQCQLSSEVIMTFPSSINIRKYLIKKFVEPVKKLTITYHITEEPAIRNKKNPQSFYSV
uniref:Tudor domain-1 n=1 Tax=Dugesia japonica TaxID=6161 RepID=D5JG63_DUGJA|nr:tudor domain-1 [Dugesia japonica]